MCICSFNDEGPYGKNEFSDLNSTSRILAKEHHRFQSETFGLNELEFCE